MANVVKNKSTPDARGELSLDDGGALRISDLTTCHMVLPLDPLREGTQREGTQREGTGREDARREGGAFRWRRAGFGADVDPAVGEGHAADLVSPQDAGPEGDLPGQEGAGQGGEDPFSAFRRREAEGLVRNVGLKPLSVTPLPIRKIRPATYLNKGQVDAIADRFHDEPAGALYVDCNLSALQQRNLERAVGVIVLDRTAIILAIFARRAQTHEGRLQVDLARLVWRRTRLVRGWTHLERQRGGVGFIAGGGETQLELDRRALDRQKESIERKLVRVRARRSGQRARRAQRFARVAMVGYTNAGKSSLFNYLTAGIAAASSRPFETLDPTSRLMRLPSGREVMLTDTVGFIKDLPTSLIAAFRATLEEATDADLVLVVRDGAAPERDWLDAEVDLVLNQLKLGEAFAESPPLLNVFNKADLSPSDGFGGSGPSGVRLSALTGEGVRDLLIALDRIFSAGAPAAWVYPDATPQGTEALAFLHRNAGATLRCEAADDDQASLRYRAALRPEQWAQLRRITPGLRIEPV